MTTPPMTHEQILLLSGEALSAAVLEHVMGWRHRFTESTWKPHKDMRAAWEVVEAMTERTGMVFSLDLLPEGLQASFYRECAEADGNAVLGHVKGDACETICRAALIALRTLRTP